MARSRDDEWIFILIFIILLFIFMSSLSKPYQKTEAMRVLEAISTDSLGTNDKVAFIYMDRIDEVKLLSMSRLNYNQIKKELGVENDFYIYIEDLNGKPLPIAGKTCIGSAKATVNGEPCG